MMVAIAIPINEEVDLEEVIGDLVHAPFMRKLIVYLVCKYVPGMRIDLTEVEFETFIEKYVSSMKPHFHIGEEGRSYLVEMVAINHENHPTENFQNGRRAYDRH